MRTATTINGVDNRTISLIRVPAHIREQLGTYRMQRTADKHFCSLSSEFYIPNYQNLYMMVSPVPILNRDLLCGAERWFPFFLTKRGELLIRAYPNLYERIVPELIGYFQKSPFGERDRDKDILSLVRNKAPTFALGGSAVAGCPFHKDGPDKDCYRERIRIITANILPILKIARSSSGNLKANNYIHSFYACPRSNPSEHGFHLHATFATAVPFNILPKPRMTRGRCVLCKHFMPADHPKEFYEHEAAYYFCLSCRTRVANPYRNYSMGFALASDDSILLAIQMDVFFILSLFQAFLLTGCFSRYLRDMAAEHSYRGTLAELDLRAVLMDAKVNLRRFLDDYGRYDSRTSHAALLAASTSFFIGVESSPYFLKTVMDSLPEMKYAARPTVIWERGQINITEEGESRFAERFDNAKKRLDLLLNERQRTPEQVKVALGGIQADLDSDFENALKSGPGIIPDEFN